MYLYTNIKFFKISYAIDKFLYLFYRVLLIIKKKLNA